MKIRRNLATAAAALTLAFAPMAAMAETLTDALVSAYRNSGLLDQQRAVLRAADEDVAQAVASLRPVLTYALSAGATNNTGTTASSLSATLSASMTLYDFGATKGSIDIAKETVLATRDALVGVEQSILLRAVAAYLDVRSAQDNLELQRSNVRVLTQDLRAARDRYEVGEVTQTDVSSAEAQLAAARAAEASAQGALAIAREEYKAAVGHYPSNLAAPPKAPMIAPTLEAAQAQARQRHPDILGAQRSVTIYEMAIKVAGASMKPTLGASASIGASTAESGGITSDSTTSSIGLSFGGPIYYGGQLSSAYRKAQANADAARANLLVAQQTIDQSVANAWANLAIASASIEATQRQIEAARVALDGTREEATLGARTTLDVLDAEQTLLDAQVSLVDAQASQYLAVYSLLSTMGLLTAEHLNLGVTAYDPAAYYNAVKSAPTYQVSPEGEKLDSVLKAIGRGE